MLLWEAEERAGDAGRGMLGGRQEKGGERGRKVISETSSTDIRNQARRTERKETQSSPLLLRSSSSSPAPRRHSLPRTLLMTIRVVPLVHELCRLSVLLSSSSSSSVRVGDLSRLLLSQGSRERSVRSGSSSFRGSGGRKVDDVGTSWWRRGTLSEESRVEEEVVEVGLVRDDLTRRRREG